jgi:hypothetical protein
MLVAIFKKNIGLLFSYIGKWGGIFFSSIARPGSSSVIARKHALQELRLI